MCYQVICFLLYTDVYMYIYIHTYICTHTRVCMYIYIYIVSCIYCKLFYQKVNVIASLDRVQVMKPGDTKRSGAH